jgi:hypothetical protein
MIFIETVALLQSAQLRRNFARVGVSKRCLFAGIAFARVEFFLTFGSQVALLELGGMTSTHWAAGCLTALESQSL